MNPSSDPPIEAPAPKIPPKSVPARLRNYWAGLHRGQRLRLAGMAIFAGIVLLAFGKPVLELISHTLKEELHSHIVLIPFITGWLLHLKAGQMPRNYQTSPVWGAGFLLAGVGALVVDLRIQGTMQALSYNDHLGLLTFSILCFLAGGAFLLLGRRWMAAAAFPAAFLLFMIPLPDGAVHALEAASQSGSAEATAAIFNLTGTTYLREGTVFSLPGIQSIEVAPECSGIRSSWVLLITCLLASHLFLESPWRRIVLVAFVIPLGLIRNGFRVATISWLCMYVDQSMIDSWVHHRGGPLFFALSLIPLGALIWWLRRSETRARHKHREEPAA